MDLDVWDQNLKKHYVEMDLAEVGHLGKTGLGAQDLAMVGCNEERENV